MSKPLNYKEIRSLYPKNFKAEFQLRLNLIDSAKSETINTKAAFPEEVWFHLCTLLEWMYRWDKRKLLNEQIDYYHFPIWLNKIMGWDRDVANCFIYAIRNPLMHVGFFSPFNKYDKALYRGQATSVSAIHHINHKSQPFLVIPGPDVNEFTITFFLDGIIVGAKKVADSIALKMSKMDKNGLAKLCKTNQAMPFRAVAN